jgi:AGZA family xanthine/uracil permease-like MFS transporter
VTVAPTALALGVLERRFNLIAHGTTVTTEVVAGLTGLAALVTAGLFLLSLFLYPLVRMIGAGYPVGQTTLYPVIAPPLVLVGTMMLAGLRHVPWDEATEAIPAFLTIVMMLMAFSITEGVAFGLASYAILDLVARPGSRPGRLDPLVYVFAALFIARYAFLR